VDEACRGGLPGAGLCARAVAACGRARQWEEALWLLAQAHNGRVSPCPTLYAGAISACGKAEEWTSAWEKALALFFEELPRQHVQPNLATYTAVISTLRGQRWKLVFELFEDIRRRGLRYDAATFAEGMNACTRASRWEQALRLFADARRRGVRPHRLMCCSALRACRRADWWARKWQLALVLFFEEMREQGPAPDEEAYHGAVTNCPGHLWALAISLLGEMLTRALAPSKTHFTSVIAACHRGREWRQVLRLLRMMQERRTEMDVMVYNAAIWGLTRGRQWRLALEFFCRMERTSEITANVVTYNTIINACMTEGNWCRALQLWFQMQQKRITPDWDTYTALLRVSEQCERWGWSRQLLDTLYKLDAPRNVDIYNAAINACRRSSRWDLGLQMFREMWAESILPNTQTYSYLVEACEEGQRFDVAMQLIEEAGRDI